MSLNNPVYIKVPNIDSDDNDFFSDVLGNKNDSISGDSVVALLKQVINTISSISTEIANTVKNTSVALDPYSGTATSGETGADVVTISASMKKIYSLLIDIGNFTNKAIVTIRAYTSINDIEKEIYSQAYRVGSVPQGIWVINGVLAISSDLRLEIQSNKSADTSVDVGYEYIEEELV